MTSAANAITASGDVAWRVEASPPGSRYAARNSSGKNIAMLHVPRISARHHHSPEGRRRLAVRSTRPVGKARNVADRSGRSGGRRRSVTRYVVPQAAGAKAVRASARQELVSGN
jgi:hypothetical protein